MRAADPDIPASTMARRLGISRERVRQLLRDLRLPTATPLSFTRDVGPGGKANHRQGAIAEMVVAADLMVRGWEVCRPLNAACAFDLLAVPPEGDEAVRVQVKSAKRYNKGQISHAGVNASCDLLALVLPGEAVLYRPPPRRR